jgi:AraC family transcriptional regulator, regulatory protein of adaptative response / methylated-DNA-[protein]-cysteine methyltransferase
VLYWLSHPSTYFGTFSGAIPKAPGFEKVCDHTPPLAPPPFSGEGELSKNRCVQGLWPLHTPIFLTSIPPFPTREGGIKGGWVNRILLFRQTRDKGGMASNNHRKNRVDFYHPLLIIMGMINYTQNSDDYARIEQVIYYLEKNAHRQPSLSEIAESVHLSEYHFQRLFSRWVGISPKRFLQFITKEHAKLLLAQSSSVLEATYQVGLSSPGRLHDLFVTWEAVTPGEFKQRGEGLTIQYGIHPTPFGEVLLGSTPRGICNLSFVMAPGRALALEALRNSWPGAQLVEDPAATKQLVARIFQRHATGSDNQLQVYLSGSNFQLKVWEALLRIPSGNVVSYRDIASYLGDARASRAVGNALAHNPVAVLIPCHRVIHSLGEYGNYHYGEARKIALLGWEMAKVAYPGS